MIVVSGVSRWTTQKNIGTVVVLVLSVKTIGKRKCYIPQLAMLSDRARKRTH